MTAFFPAPTRHYDVKKNIQSFLQNVTMRVLDESLNEKCNLEVKKDILRQRAFKKFLSLIAALPKITFSTPASAYF